MIQKDKRCQLSYPVGSNLYMKIWARYSGLHGWWISTCMVLCFISLFLPRERQIYDHCIVSRWLLKHTSGSLDGVSRRRLLESLSCKRKEKATISNTDGLPQFTAGLDEWKGRIIYWLTLLNLNHFPFSQRLVSWCSAFRVRRRANTVSFSGFLPWVAVKLYTALPGFKSLGLFTLHWHGMQSIFMHIF